MDSTKTDSIYQLYRYETAADIAKMKIPAWKKKQLTDQMDTLQLPPGIAKVYSFTNEEMYKKNTAFVSVVVGKDASFITSEFSSDSPSKATKFMFEIKPLKKSLTAPLLTPDWIHGIR